MSSRSCSGGSSGSGGSTVVRVAHRRTRPQSVSQGQTVIVIGRQDETKRGHQWKLRWGYSKVL